LGGIVASDNIRDGFILRDVRPARPDLQKSQRPDGAAAIEVDGGSGF